MASENSAPPMRTRRPAPRRLRSGHGHCVRTLWSRQIPRRSAFGERSHEGLDPADTGFAFRAKTLDGEYVNLVSTPEIAECIMRRHQRTRCLRNGSDGDARHMHAACQLVEISLCVGPVVIPVLRVYLGECIYAFLQRAGPQGGVHPDMRVIDFAFPREEVGARKSIGYRYYWFRGCEPFHHAQHLRLEMEAVIQDQVGTVQPGNVRPSEAIEMGVDAFAHQGHDVSAVFCDDGQRLADLGNGRNYGFLRVGRWAANAIRAVIAIPASKPANFVNTCICPLVPSNISAVFSPNADRKTLACRLAFARANDMNEYYKS